MELTSDYPFWSIRNGLPASYPALDRDVKCDVGIVGGGITGALAGYHLAEAGVHAVVVDKRDIGTGSTSASTGLLQYEVDVPLRELIPRIGKSKAVRSYQLCGEAVRKLGHLIGHLKIECDFAARPSLYLARSPSDTANLQEEQKLRKAVGFAVEFWSEAELGRRFPFSRPAALYSELGGEVDPHGLTHGLLAAARRRGLEVFDRTRIKRFRPGRRGIELVTDEGFVIRARRAIMAAGFESKPYLRGNYGDLKSTYALVSEPVGRIAGWHRHSLIWECGDPYFYLRTTRDHRVILGGEDVELVRPGRRDALIPRKTAVLMRKFGTLFPGAKLEVAYSWAGTFSQTKDGLAYIGLNPQLPQVYFALGYGGNGITYSLIAAEIIRDDFLGQPNPDARLFRFDR